MDFIGLEDEEGWNTALIRMALMSSCDTAIIPMQDYLELGEEGRMNLPGSQTDKNWTWRATAGYLYPGLAQRIHRLTKIFGRLAEKEENLNGEEV